MSDGVLSQEEIDALLRGGSTQEEEPVFAASEAHETTETTEISSDNKLTNEEVDTIGEVANIVMGSAATALSSLVGQKIDITTPNVSVTTLDKIRSQYPLPYLLVNVDYVKGIAGANVLVIKDSDAQLIVDLMMGGDGSAPPQELSEMHLSAIGEAMNQMMGSASTSMSTVLKRRIEISPPVLEVVNLATDNFSGNIVNSENDIVCVSFKINIEGLVDSELMQLIPLEFAREMARDLMEGTLDEETAATVAEPFAVPASEKVQPVREQVIEEVPVGNFAFGGGAEQNIQSRNLQPASNVTVQPAQFTSLNTGSQSKYPSNIDLIMDVPLQITVELGKTRKTIREILAFGPGSVIELDKLAGEPVDLMVNGKLLAKGEVVVIDENFGIRVTDIVSPMERVSNLQ